jgi:hypothetical protein
MAEADAAQLVCLRCGHLASNHRQLAYHQQNDCVSGRFARAPVLSSSDDDEPAVPSADGHADQLLDQQVSSPAHPIHDDMAEDVYVLDDHDVGSVQGSDSGNSGANR